MNWQQKKRKQAIEWADSQHATTRCARCSWSFRGRVSSGKKRFQHHSETEHRGGA